MDGIADKSLVREQTKIVGYSTRGWWAVGILTCIGILSYVDKNTIALFVGLISHDLAMTPAEATLAIGTAFAVANLLASVPAGILADRFSRKLVIFGAVVLWSIFTIFCGRVSGFGELLAFRAGVGFAEGLLPPACYSMIRDLVAPTKRARALALFSMSSLVGTGLAFSMGGLLLHAIAKASMPSALHAAHPWGIVLGIAGLAGIPLALLVFTFKEPKRDASGTNLQVPTLSATLRAMWEQRAVCVPLAVFSVADAMLTMSVNLWNPPLIDAKFGLKPAEIGVPLGILIAVTGIIGLVASGTAIDKRDAVNGRGAQVVAVVVAAILLVAAIFHPLSSSVGMFWFWQGLMTLVSTTYLLITSSLVTRVLPPSMTGRGISLFLLIQGVLGFGLAPTLTALVIEFLAGRVTEPISIAMSAMHGLLGLIALLAAIRLFYQKIELPKTTD